MKIIAVMYATLEQLGKYSLKKFRLVQDSIFDILLFYSHIIYRIRTRECTKYESILHCSKRIAL